MARILIFLSLALFACEPTTETSEAVFDNDFIAGEIGDRSFRFQRQAGEWLFPYYQAYNVDSTSVERASDVYHLILRRTDPGLTQLVELSIPLDPLHNFPYPIAALNGQLAFAALMDDSSASCPHIDSSSWTTVPVSIRVEDWVEDELTGSFTSLSDLAPGEGVFSFVIGK